MAHGIEIESIVGAYTARARAGYIGIAGAEIIVAPVISGVREVIACESFSRRDVYLVNGVIVMRVIVRRGPLGLGDDIQNIPGDNRRAANADDGGNVLAAIGGINIIRRHRCTEIAERGRPDNCTGGGIDGCDDVLLRGDEDEALDAPANIDGRSHKRLRVHLAIDWYGEY